MKITQDEITHITDEGADRMYEYDGQKYPSVTTIIGSVLDKPAITPWAYKSGIEGALYVIQCEIAAAKKLSDAQEYVLNTTVDLLSNEIKAYGKDIESKKNDGGNRGLIVHEWIEAVALGYPEPDVPPEQEPFINSIYAWLEDYEPLFLSVEQKVVHPGLGYAGTFDAIAVLQKHPPRKRHKDLTGRKCLIDFKTNNQGTVYADQHLPQVEAYAEAYSNAMGNGIIDERVVVGIGPAKDRKPKYQTTVSYANFQIFAPILEYYKQRELVRASNPNRRKK